MSERHGNTDWLERRLADPPVLPDRGFSAAVEVRIARVERLRRLVFGGIVIAWLGLVLAVWSLYPLAESFEWLWTFGERISGLIPTQLDAGITTLITEPSYAIAILLLMAAGLVLTTLQIEEW